MHADEDSADVEVGPLGSYLWEPDGAVIRARLIGDVARTLGARMLSDGIAYLTGDDAGDSPFATGSAFSSVFLSTSAPSSANSGPAVSARSRSRSAGRTSTRLPSADG